MDKNLTEEKKANIQRIFNAQKSHHQAVKNASINERKQKLRKLKSAIEAREAEVCDALWKDLRKSSFESCVWEVYLMYGEIDHAIKHLNSWTKHQSVPSHMLGKANGFKVIYEPRGVCLIIGPWNFPFQLIVGPLISAIAAGNSSMIKPASMAPATSAIIAKIIKEAFDEKEIAVVEGDSNVATELMSLPFDHIFFTGSPSVGKIVMTAAAKNLTSVTLELGGKSPVIIDETADAAKAAEKITWGKFSNSGQTCVAPDYVMIHESQKEKFIASMKESITKSYYENNQLNKNDYCKIINDGNFRRVKKLLDDAVANGAKIEVGGTCEENDQTIHPTVLTGVKLDSLIMNDEIFGPVLPVITYKNISEVLNVINSKEKALAFYIFSRNNKNIDYILSQTSSGGVAINEVVIHYTNPNLPFGGVNHSGMGSAHGFYGFKAFSHERGVMTQSRLFDMNNMIYPPYSGKVKEGVLKMYKKLI